MRSDNLTRHLKQHSEKDTINPGTNIYVTNNYNTTSAVSSEREDEENENTDEELKKYLIKIENKYQERLVQGKNIYKMLGEGVVSYQALPREMRDDVDLYMENQADFKDVGNVVLKPWQMELMKHIDNPSDRKILWVQGEKCGEGKTWFQKYVQSLLGRRRVVAGGINIHSNSASIAHALSKRPLATTDIFLFNIGKARNREQEVNYSFIEDLKDGNVFASKYDSKELMIKVPNIVMVFSNSTPDVKELARDRWNIFSIENDELVKRQISKSWPPVVLTSNKNQSNGFKKKKYPQDSDNDSDSDCY